MSFVHLGWSKGEEIFHPKQVILEKHFINISRYLMQLWSGSWIHYWFISLLIWLREKSSEGWSVSNQKWNCHSFFVCETLEKPLIHCRDSASSQRRLRDSRTYLNFKSTFIRPISTISSCLSHLDSSPLTCPDICVSGFLGKGKTLGESIKSINYPDYEIPS